MDIIQLEKPLQEIINKITELKASSQQNKSLDTPNIKKQISDLENQFTAKAKTIYKNLSAYQIVQISRHPNRPYSLDIINQLCTSFIELHGDRNFMDDPAIIAGIGIFKGHRVAIIGHQKGRNTKENMLRNFGMPKPEGYRKALRIMLLAEQFSLPILTFIDTPGAYPGIDAEERGQSEAIAKNIMIMTKLRTPIISTVIGEGGSGGALAIGVANRVLMMQYSIYSVISPEGCASILWKDAAKADQAANILGLSADKAFKHKIIDAIIPEPCGGAHWHPYEAIELIGENIEKNLLELNKLSTDELKNTRMEKFFAMGETKINSSIMPKFNSAININPQWTEEWENIKNKFT